MPRKISKATKGGTEGGEQSRTEFYKKKSNYKELVIFDDGMNKDIKALYDNNVWDLKAKFEELKLYYEQVGISDIVSWNEGIQYLDNPAGKAIQVRPTSIKALRNGDYKAIGTEKPNKQETEKRYADRIQFYIKTFEPFKRFKDNDDFSWIVPYNRILFYEIFQYNNKKKLQLSTFNNDLKTMIRLIKIVLLNPDDELRWKYSALQIAIRDLDGLKDDLNQILSVNELKSFIPYEQLLDVVDELEKKYNEYLQLLPANIRNDYRKHPNDAVFINQILIAVAIMVLDYPSRLDKFEMEIINDKKDVKPNKCYILTTNPLTFIFNNDKKNHKPLEYKLNATPILGLNKRLNKLIVDSLTHYPRNTLFIKKDTWSSQLLTPVNEDTVAGWIKDILPNKSLNVGTFRSSFVSYYYPKSNNQEKKIMAHRMRTSQFELVRAYLKFYNSPDTLAKVKLEPTQDLLQKASSGQATTPIKITDTPKIKQEVQEEQVVINAPQQVKEITNIQEQRRINAKKWYENDKNREEHKAKVKAHSKDPLTYKSRYLRDLNSGRMDISRIKPETIEKYNIKLVDGKYV